MSVMFDTPLPGRYRRVRRLGSGGTAAVFLAEDQRLGRRVAVKRLHADSPEDVARRFDREARLGASLNHPNIVSVYDVTSDEEGVIIVVEYVEGETLRDVLRLGPLPTARALEIVSAVASALDHAHARRVVHRDVKPANVLLGRDGGVKLADLGIATAVGTPRVTASGVVLGTPAYMAPEQLEGGEAVGPAADTYALAAVAFEALSGRRARSGKTPLELARRARDEPPPDLRDAWPAAPAAAAEELQRGLCRDPAGRPLTAGELARGLSTAVRPDKESVDPIERTLVMPLVQRTNRRARQTTPADAPFAHRSSRATEASGPPSGQRRARVAVLAGTGLLALLAVAVVGLSISGSESPSGGGPRQAEGPAAGTVEREGSGAEQPPTTAETAPPDAGGQGVPGAPEDGVPAPSGENDPALGTALNDQGKALIDEGRPAEAVAVLQRAVAAFPPGSEDVNYGYALFNLGNALYLADRSAEAIPVLERRLEIPNQRPTVRRALATAREAAE
jgi:serine/threonine protein kinase